MDAPCNTRTIRRHLNNEKIKHKKIIHHPRLTMKHKEKWLEYACQYQTMSTKEWWKVVFSDKKKFSLNGPDDFQKYWHSKKFSRRELLKKWRRISYDGVGGSHHLRKTLTTICQWLTKRADYVKMLNDLFLAQEGCCLWEEKWIFHQDNAAIHNASITKKYLLEQKIRLLDHPVCSPDLSPIEDLWGLIVAKVYEGGW